MGVKKMAAKLAEYYARLDNGKTKKIKPEHVRKVLEKLRMKSTQLQEDIDTAENEGKKERLRLKLQVATEQIARAEWLLAHLD